MTILEPMDGALLTLATDTRSDIAGVQTSFTVQAVGVAVGDRVDLILEDDSIVGTETVPDSGEILFADVTLPSGQHTIVAATRTTDIRSTPITVEVQDGCATIDFVTPAPTGSRVTFGPADDTDGEACAGSFETTVVIATDAGDGATARVFVNDVPRTTTTVTGTTARFEGVAFDIGSMPNRLMVEVTNSDGVACQQTFGPEIYVDCEGVSCRITAPVTTGAFLNESHDVSDADGFQGDFEVTTDADGAGQAVRLVIDGNETDALSAMPTMMGTDGVASFGNVPLSEGVHRIQAICSDAAGNPTRTSAEWTVDITPCGVAIATPTEGALFNDTDDLDSGTDGIQIDLDGDASGDACTMVRTGHCSSLPDFGSFGGAGFSSRVTLGTAASQELCAQVQDEAGNVGEARVNIRVRTDAPQLEIASPTTGTGYNASGTGGRTADAQPSSSTCGGRVHRQLHGRRLHRHADSRVDGRDARRWERHLRGDRGAARALHGPGHLRDRQPAHYRVARLAERARAQRGRPARRALRSDHAAVGLRGALPPRVQAGVRQHPATHRRRGHGHRGPPVPRRRPEHERPEAARHARAAQQLGLRGVRPGHELHPGHRHHDELRGDDLRRGG
ncbi:MAG: hypothetical protein M5U28_48170 [Sandaracinaceae bacterium]|nr:hypothetical protein [Sandaracinaceae bacterium]